MRPAFSLILAAFFLCSLAFGQEAYKERVRAPGKPEGQVTTFRPAKGRKLKQMQVEETSGNIKRVLFHRSPTCNGPYGIIYDGRPAMGELLTGLPEKDVFYIKVIGTGDLVLIPDYK